MTRRLAMAALIVLVAVAGLVPFATAHDPADDIAVRDDLIQQQEALLNVYRCMFDIDTQLVPGGCADSPAPRPEPRPTPQPGQLALVDSYWGGDYFYLVFDNVPAGYCKVNLTLDGRRVGEWTNDIGEAGRRTFDFFLPELLGRPDFDGYEIECR